MADDFLQSEGHPITAGGLRLTSASLSQTKQFCDTHKIQVLTILLTDLVGSTSQQQALGNVRAAELVKLHRKLFRDVLSGHDGQEVETAGDSFLAVFAAPSEGVRFALSLQQAMRVAQQETPELPSVRLGIHQGQIVVEHHDTGQKSMDVYGLQVSTAARAMDLAGDGQILCTRSVFDDARAILREDDLQGFSNVTWCNHGPYRFKGVDEAYEICEVGETDAVPPRRPPASSKSWPADESGEVLGWRPAAKVTVPTTNWLLIERLGKETTDSNDRIRYKGEFGEVWKAYNPSDKSYQVFKFCFKRENVPALKREARLLKQLKKQRHPNLVEVYDVTEGDQPPYYMEMEYVEGPSLEEWLKKSPPLKERLELIAQVADALDTVHAAGIYHRDIKPSNILLTYREDGTLQAKVTDFGLGAAEDPELLKSIYASRVTGVAGTWDYIAPELRENGKPSPQSDIYSLGVTLFQTVIGNAYAPLGDWQSEIESEILREDLRKSLASDPKSRWAKANDLAQALRTHDQRVRERRLEEDRARQHVRNKRLALAGMIVCVIAIIAIGFGGVAAWQWREATTQKREAEAQTARANEENKQRNVLLHQVLTGNAQRAFDSRQYAETALWRLAAIEAAEKANINTREDKLALLASLPFNPIVTDWQSTPFVDCWLMSQVSENTVWALAADGGIREGILTSNNTWEFSSILNAHQDVQRFAYCSGSDRAVIVNNDKIFVYDPNTRQQVFSYPDDGRHVKEALTPCPDNSSVLFVIDNVLSRIDSETLQIEAIQTLPYPLTVSVYNCVVEWNRNIAILQMTTEGERRLSAIDLTTGKELLNIERQGSYVPPTIINNYAVYCGSDQRNEITIIPLADVTAYTQIVTPWTACGFFSHSPDSFQLFHGDGKLRTWSYSGELLSTKGVPNVSSLTGAILLPSGLWLSNADQTSCLDSQDFSIKSRIQWHSRVSKAQPYSDNEFLVLSDDALELRSLATGNVNKIIPVDADDFVLDTYSDGLIVRKGGTLYRYDLAELLEGEVDTTSAYTARVEDASVKTLTFDLIDGESILAATPSGIYRLDALTLEKRERLAYQDPEAIYTDDFDYIWIASKNDPQGRLELLPYSRYDATSHAPIYVLVNPDEVTAIHFDTSSRTLLWGKSDGTLSSASLVTLDWEYRSSTDPLIIPPDKIDKILSREGEALTSIQTSGENSIAATQSGGRLLHLRGKEAPIVHVPFLDNSVSEVVLIDDSNGLLLLSQTGECALIRFQIASTEKNLEASVPSGFSSCYNGTCLVYPEGASVIVNKLDGTHVPLTNPKVSSNTFINTALNTGLTQIAAINDEGTLFLWLTDDVLTAQFRTPRMIETISGYPREMLFIDDHTLLVTSEEEYSVIHCPADSIVEPVLIYHGSVQRNGQPLTISHACFADNHIYFAAELDAQPFLNKLDLASGATEYIPLHETVRSLTVVGATANMLLVGGIEKAYVVDLSTFQITGEIELPENEGRADTYYVRNAIAIPETEIVALGTRRSIYFADLSNGSVFFFVPTSDYVWRMSVDSDNSFLHWIGDYAYGSIPLPDFSGSIPTVQDLELMTGLRHENGVLVGIKRGFVMQPDM